MKFLKLFSLWFFPSLGLLLLAPAAFSSDATNLQLELVEQRIEALRQQGETSEGSATLRAYQETLNWLREMEGQDQLAKQFQEDLLNAPREETKIRERMSSGSSQAETLDPETLQELDWTSLNNKAGELQASLAKLAERRDALDQKIADASSSTESIRVRLVAIDAEEVTLPTSSARFEIGGSPSQFEATQWLLAAHRRALQAERQALNAQLAAQPAVSRKRRAEREELVRDIEYLQQALTEVSQVLATLRPDQAEQALEDIDPGIPGYDFLKQLADENIALTQHLAELSKQVTAADTEKTRVDGKLFELMESFNAARRLVDSGGRSSVYGPFLMNYFQQLDQYRPPPDKLRQSNDIDEIVIERARHDQQLAELLNTSDFITDRAQDQNLSLSNDSRTMAVASSLVLERRELLSDLMSSETRLVQTLGKMDVSYEQLDSLANEFESFLIGHILWVRSHLPLDSNIVKQVLVDLRQAADSLRSSLSFSIRLLPTLALLAGLGLLLLRRKMWRRMESINRRVGRPRDDSFMYSIEAFLLTMLRSAAIPLVMVGIALNMDNSPLGPIQPIALTLLLATPGVMTALFLRDANAPGGICRIHFDWPENRSKAVMSLMSWGLVRLLPVGLVAGFLVHLEQSSPHAVLGRLSLCIVAVMLAMKALRMLRQQRKIDPGNSFTTRLQDGLVVGLTIFLMAIVLAGFLLPARIIYYSIAATALTFIVLVFVQALLMRWLLVMRRRLRFQQLLAAQPGTESEEKASSEARQASIGDLSDSTAQLIKSVVYTLGAVAIVMIWSPLLPAIQGLQQFTLWTVNQTVNGVEVQTHITMATIVLALLIFIVTFYAARRLPSLIDLVMRSTGKSTASTRYTVSTITNYMIIAIGTMVFFSTLKMSWSQLQWLVAALGVGIGFGLQEIVANFISGLIILFEKPIRVGDVVTIGDSSGEVTRIQIRATTIRDWDGKELLVPNKEFITGRLLNWTLSDTTNRVVIEVGIAYGSDVNQAIGILEKVVTAHPAVLKEPAPNILFTQFGDNALHLSARCFLSDLQDRLRRISELHQQIYTAFNDAGIVIAFPQLDVHMDPDSPLTVRFENDPKKT